MRSLQNGFLLLVLTQLIGCGDQVVGWPIDETIAPTVIATTPVDGAPEVLRDTSLSATFSEPMDLGTITGATFSLVRGTTPIAGMVGYVGVTATFDPTDALDAGVVYTARITRGATDLSGNPLAVDHVWTFTIGGVVAPDTTRPQVSSTTPANAATEVALDAPLSATFTEPMAPDTISTSSFTLLRGATPVTGTVAYVGVTALFTPTVDLASDTVYTATITNAATDLAGNPLVADHVWTFTTGTAPDLTPPLVSATIPTSGAIGVPLATSLVATFSEAMNPLTVSSATFTLRRGATTVPGTVTFVGVTATFDPTDDLEASTSYTATVSDAATDLAGNPLAQDYVWSFTTGAAADTTPPRVSATTPTGAATGVALNSALTATFSEAMNPLTVTAATFTLARGETAVPGGVTYTGVTATFDPNADLLPNTRYTATIHTGAADLSGVPLAADHVWSFTTGPTPDTLRPRVTFTIPSDEDVDVLRDTSVLATFDKAMNTLTLNAATFTLKAGALGVPGTVTAVGNLATFDPTEALEPNTEYTATVTTGARDLAGNALAADYVWTFTTWDPLESTCRHASLSIL